MGGNGLRALIILLGLFTACGQDLPMPEATARSIVRGAFARDFAGLSGLLSGEPLKLLLAVGKPGEGFDRFCRGLVKLEKAPAKYEIQFVRAVYQNDGTQVALHFAVTWQNGPDEMLAEAFWRLQLMEGGWKLVAFQ